jgi:hypothetical protein
MQYKAKSVAALQVALGHQQYRQGAGPVADVLKAALKTFGRQ